MGLMPDWPDLYLMRHGQTVWNAEGRMQGRLDSPLTPLGEAQARRLAWLVRDLRGAARYASTAGRARQTAGIVFGGRGFTLDERLHEIDIGAFAGRLSSDLRAAHPEVFACGGLGWYDRAPGGEHFSGLEARVRAFLGDLTGPALIVTHGITLRMLRLVAMGLPLERLAEMPVMQGALHLVSGGRHRVFF
ncbi:histidine phosphatase family protein [Paracoccus denitrificans]|jgi:probable phosphoglycerate mutase|uniref:Phosphoglycerate mutase n=2 Tax=Paracoccus denitrificans TaxID=266 RepID=A1B2V4_PARDP|nr:Phosphoglycerate mutase [Paracoccus denitrificans PD1222]QAR25248.1 histidine phosphatase family protein [Paracoccus denitrificans]